MAGFAHCDLCGGPARWTLIHGDVFYHCESGCSGFMQADLLDDELVRKAREETLRESKGIDAREGR